MSFERSKQSGVAKDAQLQLMRESLARQTYPGYPASSERLVMDPTTLTYDPAGRVILPDGPWTVNSHTGCPKPEREPSLAEQAKFAEQGYALDSRGRPLHPWFLAMLADPAIGLVLGKGTNWEWGELHTVDGIVRKNGHVLLITRGDTGERATPGGFVDPKEQLVAAARREIQEETGLTIPETAEPKLIYQGPVADIRSTANAWHHTSAFVFDLGNEGPLPQVQGRDDARTASWVPENELFSGEQPYFGGHRFLLAQGLGGLSLAQQPYATK